MDKKKINSKVSSDIKRNQDVTLLVVSLLISGAFLWLVVAPIYRNKSEIEAVNFAKEEDLRNKQELLSNIESFNKNNKDLSVNSQKLVAMIPNRNNFEDFLFYLKDKSRAYNMELVDMSLISSDSKTGTPGAAASAATAAAAAAEAESGELKEQGISMKLRGSYSDFINFTKSLENTIAFLQEDSFQINVADSESGAGESQAQALDPNPILDFDLNLRFIYY